MSIRIQKQIWYQATLAYCAYNIVAWISANGQSLFLEKNFSALKQNKNLKTKLKKSSPKRREYKN